MFVCMSRIQASCQEQIEIEFGGLDWEWHPIQANEKYLKWIEDNVVVRPHVRASALPGVGESHGKPRKTMENQILHWLDYSEGPPVRLVRLTWADHGHQVPMKNRQMEPIFKAMSVRNKYCNPCVCFPTSETVLHHYSTVYSHSFVKGMNILHRYYVHTSNCIAVHIHVWMYLYGYIYLCNFENTHKKKHTQIHKYVFIYIYIYVKIDTYIYI